jgi:ASC-1-like (ASCH) protein
MLMHLDNESFCLLRDGRKKIESRIYDKKRQLLKIGAVIKMQNRETDEILIFRVKNLLRAKTFSQLITTNKIEDFGAENKSDYLKLLYSLYSKEDEAALGVVGIELVLT